MNGDVPLPPGKNRKTIYITVQQLTSIDETTFFGCYFSDTLCEKSGLGEANNPHLEEIAKFTARQLSAHLTKGPHVYTRFEILFPDESKIVGNILGKFIFYEPLSPYNRHVFLASFAREYKRLRLNIPHH